MNRLIMLQGSRTRHLTVDAMLCVFAIMLSYLEVLLPLSAWIPLPGFRPGLANVAVVIVFALLSPMDAAVVSAVRILLMGFLFGSVTSFYFSVAGGFCSYLLLLGMKQFGQRCSFFGLSVLSAAAHNTGQLLAAVTLFGPMLLTSYLPMLLFASIVYGGIVGILLNFLIPKLKPHTDRLLNGGNR